MRQLVRENIHMKMTRGVGRHNNDKAVVFFQNKMIVFRPSYFKA